MIYKAVSSLVFVWLTIGMLNADTLELKNGSVIKGSYVGGSDTTISFRVGSSVQQYSLADIASLKFDEREPATPARSPGFAERSPDNAAAAYAPASPSQIPGSSAATSSSVATATSIPRATSQSMVVPSGTRVTIRTIDGVDSDKNHP